MYGGLVRKTDVEKEQKFQLVKFAKLFHRLFLSSIMEKVEEQNIMQKEKKTGKSLLRKRGKQRKANRKSYRIELQRIF